MDIRKIKFIFLGIYETNAKQVKNCLLDRNYLGAHGFFFLYVVPFIVLINSIHLCVTIMWLGWFLNRLHTNYFNVVNWS